MIEIEREEKAKERVREKWRPVSCTSDLQFGKQDEFTNNTLIKLSQECVTFALNFFDLPEDVSRIIVLFFLQNQELLSTNISGYCINY